jgi:toxin ParE1/3/4
MKRCGRGCFESQPESLTHRHRNRATCDGALGAAASADVRRIFRYIARENPVAAQRIARELTLAGDSLALFPYRGRPGRTPGTRELSAVHPYVIVYEVERTDVTILLVWHSAQDRR